MIDRIFKWSLFTLSIIFFIAGTIDIFVKNDDKFPEYAFSLMCIAIANLYRRVNNE